MASASFPNWERETARKSASISIGPCHFLAIPLEIREHIYELMLDLHLQHHLNLISTCKQIYSEAIESFLRRPLTCPSQDALQQFVRCRPKSMLKHMTNLRLHLREADSEVMQPFILRISAGISSASEQHPYPSEINRITSALAKLPNLTQLSLLVPADSRVSAPSSIIINAILLWATQHYTALQSLRIDIENCDLDGIAMFPNLRSFQTIGFSRTSPSHTGNLLGTMLSITSLSIIGPPRGLQMRQRYGYQFNTVQSINHCVLEQMRPLRRLFIKEVAEPKSGGVFLTTRMLKSIYDRHRESLREFQISSILTPDAAFITFLEALLMATPNICELALAWPDMQVPFVDCIPPSTQRLSLAVTSHMDAQAFIDRLRAIQYRLPYLKSVRFEVINGAHGQMSNTQAEKASVGFMIPIQHLNL